MAGDAPSFAWRPATAADVPALAALYRDAAQALGPRVYTPVQTAAWAAFASDAPGFRAYLLDADTWLAERPGDGAILGFCGVGLHGDKGDARELQSLYVEPASTRRGLGAEMLRRTLARAEADGAHRFAAWATPFSRPVFLRQGFVLARTVVAPFGGTMFERYRVERG